MPASRPAAKTAANRRQAPLAAAKTTATRRKPPQVVASASVELRGPGLRIEATGPAVYDAPRSLGLFRVGESRAVSMGGRHGTVRDWNPDAYSVAVEFADEPGVLANIRVDQLTVEA